MFFAFLALVLAGAVFGQSLPFTDHGTLKITSNGQLLGTERFDIEPAGDGYRMRGELKVKMPNGGEATESTVMNLAKDLTITSYTRLQKSPKKASAQVDFVAGHAKAHYVTPDGPTDYEFMIEASSVILDTNFFHHFALLLQRYDFKKGGAQHVQVLIPQEATPGMILLEYLGKDDGRDKWQVKTDALEMHVWTDGGKLMKVSAPDAKVEVVRDSKN